MSLHVQRIFSKLPKYFACTDGSYRNGCSKLSFLQGDKRACSFLAPACTKDFRFPNAVFRPLICVHQNLLQTKHGMNVCQRYNSTDKESKDKSLVQGRENPYAHLTVGQKVKEAGKDATYTVVIVAGIAVTGLMFYMIGTELLSSESPSGIYGDALKKCQNSIEVTAALGEPLKGYGETTRRGRRRHVSHTEFEVRGIPHMRMRFYIEGPYKKATVHVEVQKGDSGKYEYRYLVVETEGYPQRSFVLEDAR